MDSKELEQILTPNAVLIPTVNNVILLEKTLRSVVAQTVPTTIIVWDNGSTDATGAMLNCEEPAKIVLKAEVNLGVSHAWNTVLGGYVFKGNWNFKHCLVVNHDVILPPWFYESLLSRDVPFVTGASISHMDEIAERQAPTEMYEGPDFSAFLIRKEAWDLIGPFDAAMVNYCQDLDYHLRAYRKGLHLWNSGERFYHERSSTIRNASSRERKILLLRADADREVFHRKWGVAVGSEEYGKMFSPDSFGCERHQYLVNADPGTVG